MQRHLVQSWVIVMLASCSSDGSEPPSTAAGRGGAGGSSAGASGSVAGSGSGGSSSGAGGAAGSAGAGGTSTAGGAGAGGVGGAGAGSGGQSGAGGNGNGGGGGSGGQSGAGGASCGAPCGEPSGYEVGCCGDRCTGLYNDPMHCGDCDTVCPASAPFCDNGRCGPLPCSGASCDAGRACCGSVCCETGQICCGVNVGPFIYQCHTPTEEMPSCPIGCPTCLCASPDTPIATADGERPIASIAVGDLVYSVDRGTLTLVPVSRVNRSPAVGHHVVHVTLATGAVLEISAPHPTADGRRFGELSVGSELGGVEVVGVELRPYEHAFTYDILPASDTGSYVAAGVLIGSTLAEQPAACVP